MRQSNIEKGLHICDTWRVSYILTEPAKIDICKILLLHHFGKQFIQQMADSVALFMYSISEARRNLDDGINVSENCVRSSHLPSPFVLRFYDLPEINGNQANAKQQKCEN